MDRLRDLYEQLYFSGGRDETLKEKISVEETCSSAPDLMEFYCQQAKNFNHVWPEKVYYFLVQADLLLAFQPSKKGRKLFKKTRQELSL